jgi:dTDP-glucose pyrophosphorylase
MDKLSLVVPMAGRGNRFIEQNYDLPKPLINIFKPPELEAYLPMIGGVLNSLGLRQLGIPVEYTFIAQKEHVEQYPVNEYLQGYFGNQLYNMVTVDHVTEGAACTVLLAEQYINNRNPVLIANADQLIEWKPENFFNKVNTLNADGGILTFRANHPKWSYVKTDSEGVVTEVVEKQVVSDIATVGCYYWQRGKDLVWSIKEMIRKNIRTNNEFYLAPSINELIKIGQKFVTFDVDKMIGLGTPNDLRAYLNG